MDQRQLDVIEQLYQAILQPEKWQDLTQLICDDLGAFGFNIVILDRVFTEIQNTFVSRDLIEPFQQYVGQGFYAQEVAIAETLDITTAGNCIVDLETVAKEHNKISDNSVDTTAANLWMKNELDITQRYFYSLGNHQAQLDSLHLCLTSSQDALRAVNRCNFYLPHLSNLVNTSRPFMLLKARFNAVLEVLNKLNLAVFLLSDKGALIDCNEAAQEVVSARDAIYLNNRNYLQFNDLSQTTHFYQQLSTFAKTEHKNRKESFIAKRKSSELPYLCELSGIRHNDIPIGALLIVSDPLKKQQINTSNFIELFGLTKSEQVVCQLLAEGKTNREIAERRSTSIETIRSQTKAILHKTGTNRQVDLMRLAFSINIPVDTQ